MEISRENLTPKGKGVKISKETTSCLWISWISSPNNTKHKELWLGQRCCGVPNHWRKFWRIIPVCKFSWVTALERSKKLSCNTKGQVYFSLKVYKPTESFLFQLWISACYLISRDFRSCMPLVRKLLVQFLGDWLIRNCRNRAILLVDISFKLYS